MKRDHSTQMRFIGGHHNGLTMDVPDHHRYIVLPIQQEPLAKVIGEGEAIDTYEMEYQTYQRVSIRGNTKTFDVMAPPGVSGDELISRLISGYRQ